MIEDTGKQFDSCCDRSAQPVRRHLGQEQRNAETDRHGDEHGDGGRHQRAEDQRHGGAELAGADVPVAGEEIEAGVRTPTATPRNMEMAAPAKATSTK